MTPRDTALAAFVSVTWGLAFVATRFGLEGFTAPQLTALRFLVASVPVLFVARPAVPWHLLVLIGLSLFAGQFLLLFLAFRHGMPPGLASVTQQTHVFLTVLLAALLFGERPTARQGLGMTLAVAGLVLVGLTVGADLPALALALALSGALSWAAGNLLLKHVRGVPMFPLIAWCSLVPPLPMLLLSTLWGRGVPAGRHRGCVVGQPGRCPLPGRRHLGLRDLGQVAGPLPGRCRGTPGAVVARDGRGRVGPGVRRTVHPAALRRHGPDRGWAGRHRVAGT